MQHRNIPTHFRSNLLHIRVVLALLTHVWRTCRSFSLPKLQHDLSSPIFLFDPFSRPTLSPYIRLWNGWILSRNYEGVDVNFGRRGSPSDFHACIETPSSWGSYYIRQSAHYFWQMLGLSKRSQSLVQKGSKDTFRYDTLIVSGLDIVALEGEGRKKSRKFTAPAFSEKQQISGGSRTRHPRRDRPVRSFLERTV